MDKTDDNAELNALKISDRRALTAPEFQALAEVPPAIEWFANIDNANTRRAYQNDVQEFLDLIGIAEPDELRIVTRSHVLAWRKTLEARELASATIRRKLSALSSLFDYLCDHNAVTHNPVDGVKRPVAENNNEGKTPALSDDQARALLNAPEGGGLKAHRDRAILSTYLFHGLRRNELVGLKVGHLQERRGVMHFTVHGKGSKTRYVPIHPGTIHDIDLYLEACGHGGDRKKPLFMPVKNNCTGELGQPITGDGLLKMVKHYATTAGITMDDFCLHSLRATAATNALDNEADIAKVQDWLGHANISTTRLYDHRKNRPEESPTFRVKY